MAIIKDELTAKAKRGWSWRFGMDGQPWANWEAKLVAEMEAQGITHNIRRLDENETRREQIRSIKVALADSSDEQIAAVLAALGLS
jgi:hypothetical protein